MNEDEGRKEKGETKEEGQGKRERDTSEGIDLMLFHMICPPGVGGRIGKVE